jgi:hypothetical protein
MAGASVERRQAQARGIHGYRAVPAIRREISACAFWATAEFLLLRSTLLPGCDGMSLAETPEYFFSDEVQAAPGSTQRFADADAAASAS